MQALLNIIFKLGDMIYRCAGHIGCACGGRQVGQIEGTVHIAVNGGGGEAAGGGQRGILAAGHAVDVVVDDHHGDIDVAAAGMDQVVAADGGGVAVAGDDDDVEIGVGHLDAGGKGQRPAVGGVEGIKVHIARRAGGAADTRNHHRFLGVKLKGIDGADDGADNSAVAAAGAPDMGQFVVAQILQRVVHSLITAITFS